MFDGREAETPAFSSGASLQPFSTASVLLLLSVALCAIYLPSVGHGFVKDDFVWIASSRFEAGSLQSAFTAAPTGFFRPVVSLSFAVNRWFCGLHPLCYGLTNFLLLAASAAGVAAMSRSLGLPSGAAIFAAALWAFNWHGINMAVLWISGRTALLLVLFATWSAAAFYRRRWVVAAALCLAAMLSKEEAVALPVILAASAIVVERMASTSARRPELRRLLVIASVVVVLEIVYAAIRLRSGAYTFATAPSYYQFRFTTSMFLSNLAQYLDRSATFPVVVLLLFGIMCRPRPPTPLLVEGSNASLTPLLVIGVLWWIGGLALTMFLPVRSSLYACFPSVGVALIVAALASELWKTIHPRRRRRAALAGVLLPFLLWPVYHARNRRMASEAELSTRTLAAIDRHSQTHGAGTVILLEDDRAARPSLDQAFGALLQPAVDLMVPRPVVVAIDPPPTDTAAATYRLPSRPNVVLALRNGALIEVR